MSDNTINERTKGTVIIEHLKRTLKYIYLREIKKELLQEQFQYLEIKKSNYRN